MRQSLLLAALQYIKARQIVVQNGIIRMQRQCPMIQSLGPIRLTTHRQRRGNDAITLDEVRPRLQRILAKTRCHGILAAGKIHQRLGIFWRSLFNFDRLGHNLGDGLGTFR